MRRTAAFTASARLTAKLRLLPLLIWVLLCLPAVAQQPHRFVVVPLDNRPANVLFVRQIARIAGAQVLTPPDHWLGSWLNPGNGERATQWAGDTAQPGDTVIVSSDMLCYGGLVGSRNAAVSEQQALARLALLDRLKPRGGQLQVLATVPRLYLRTSEGQAPYETPLATWAAHIDVRPTPQHYPPGVPARWVEEYLAVRKRNQAVNLALLDRLERGLIDKLVIGQDDSSAHGLHHLDQEELARRLGPKAMLLSGADELTMDMVAGRLTELHNIHPVLGLEFSEAGSERKIPPLESHPLETMLEQHLELCGARRAPHGGQEDVHIFVQVPAAHPFAMPPESERPKSSAFAERIRHSVVQGRLTALADLALINRMDPYLAQALLERVPLTRLEGIAAWNTPANAFGTVVAQVVARRIADQRAAQWKIAQVKESARTHLAFSLARVIDDYGYQTLLRARFYREAHNLPTRPDPLLNPFVPLGRDVRIQLIAWSRELYARRFENLPIELPGNRGSARLGPMLLEVVLPWPRLFEVQVRLDLALLPLLPAPPAASHPDTTPDSF
jgi:hypothetical protein